MAVLTATEGGEARNLFCSVGQFYGASAQYMSYSAENEFEKCQSEQQSYETGTL